jgi:hypothetical protein
MRDTVDWLAAEADESDELLGDQHPRLVSGQDATTRTGNREEQSEDFSQELSEDQNPHFRQNQPEVGHPEEYATRLENDCDYENERVRRIYRARVVTMLRRYLQYSIETGRLPSLLGREFFRAKVTSYTVVTFEDRVIFVHDMEKCLEKLDEFSRQLIGRHILQEHDQAATGRLLGCTERTVRTYIPIVLDLFTEILFDVGLLAR